MAELQEKPRVLIVDDVPSNLDILAVSLRDDYQVQAATNGITALTIARRVPHPDLILLDVMMPEMDGFEVCRQLKQDPATRNIPVIFITAKAGEADEELGLTLGALDYVTKPFSVPVVKARVRNHVRLAMQEKQLRAEIAAHKAAREGLEIAYLVYSTTSQAMMLTDAADTIVAVNPAFTHLTGYSDFEVIGQTPRMFSSGRHDAAFFSDMRQKLEETGAWQGEIWNRRKNGELYAEALTINTVFNEDGSVRQRVALFSDITDKKRIDEEIWQHANFDALTNLPNRRRFHDRLSEEIKRAKRDGLPLALFYIDLDFFKEVNDTLGHDMGDLLLTETARRLRLCARESDTVGRLGGDEFALIMVDISDVSGIDRVAQCIVRAMAEPFVLGDREANISASIGISLYPTDAVDIAALVRNADHAMYEAKQQGRNRYCYYSATVKK